MSSGKPASLSTPNKELRGALETIAVPVSASANGVSGPTGIFFDDQTEISLAQAVGEYYQTSWNPDAIRQHALRFDKENFKKLIIDMVRSS